MKTKSLIALGLIFAASLAHATGSATVSAATSGFAASGTLGGKNSASISAAAQNNTASAYALKLGPVVTTGGTATSVGGGFNHATHNATGGYATGGVGSYSTSIH